MKAIFDKIRQHNVWDGQLFSIGFERSLYLERIGQFIGNKLIKVIIGQRRVGKSYVLRQIMNRLIHKEGVNPKNIFYLNKEYISFAEIKLTSDLDALFKYYRNKLDVQGKVYIFLDEIQNIHQWEVFVNSYAQDYTNKYEIFITGSNSNLLSGELATLLSGRYVEFTVLPFSLWEYAAYKNRTIGKDIFIEYLQKGGLPELLHLPEEEVQNHYIESLKDTIVLRDIVYRHKIKDVGLLDDIFHFLSINIGNITSISSLIKYFKQRQKKTNYETISNYINHLTDTFIFHEAERYNLRGKQVLGNHRKYYLNDLSFKNYLYGYTPSDIGYNLENFVYLYLKGLGYKVHVGVQGEKEIDFVAQKKGKTLYFQVTYLLSSSNTMEREFGNLLSIKDNYEKYVISMDDIAFTNYEGIRHLRPWELHVHIK